MKTLNSHARLDRFSLQLKIVMSLGCLIGLVGCSSLSSQPSVAPLNGPANAASLLPDGYPRFTGQTIPWTTQLKDVPWLQVVSGSGSKKTAGVIPVPENAKESELPEAFIFIDDVLQEVKVLRRTDLPEAELRIQLERFSELYGDPMVKSTLDGKEYHWRSNGTQLTLRQIQTKNQMFAILVVWSKTKT